MVPLDESRTWAQIRPILLSLGPPYITCTPIGYAGQDSDFGPGTDKLVFKDAGRLNWMTWTSDSITAIRPYLFGGDHIEHRTGGRTSLRAYGERLHLSGLIARRR